MLKVLFLLFLVSLLPVCQSCQSSSNSQSCSFGEKSDKTNAIIYGIFKVVTEILLSISPVDPINPVIGFSEGLNERDPDYEGIVTCFISKYHGDQLFSATKINDDRTKDYPTNSSQLQRIIEDMEDSDSLAKLTQSKDYLKASVYPILAYRAGTHLRAYKLLIRTVNKNGKWSSTGEKYAKKHDEWVLYYVQLILRYWRPYRKSLIEQTNKADVNKNFMYRNPSIVQSPAEHLLRAWQKIPYYKNSQAKIKEILDTCIVESSKRVMFNVLYNQRYLEFPDGWMDVGKEWLSCWVSGTKCHSNQCPNIYTGQDPSQSPFQYGDQFDFGIHCRGEVFWIYSVTPKITDGNQINLKYSTKDGEGYYMSLRDTRQILIYLDTKTCPSKTWTHIRPDCGAENFDVDKAMVVNSSNVVYDGNLLCFAGRSHGRDSCLFETDINMHGAETLKIGELTIPARII